MEKKHLREFNNLLITILNKLGVEGMHFKRKNGEERIKKND
jgi:hypothetical protein